MAGLESYWYRTGPAHLILLPVSWLLGALASLRRLLYRCGMLDSVRLPVPVVVIGNISVGGTGKTPLTLALAQVLTDKGHHPVIVSRGYGGSASEQAVYPYSTAVEVGDEPLLMAQRGICPVWVGPDRAATALAALKIHPQCNVILCDDGLQHYRLQRDMEICVVDGVRRFGNGHLLPAGPLREPVSRLKTVDAVVVNGGEASDGEYAIRLSGDVFYNLKNPGETATAEHFKDMRVHAVAGIGHPQRFFDHLKMLGLNATPHPFPDHHPYHSDELNYSDCDALLLTEKDAVKCATFADDKFWALRVDARIDPALTDQLMRKIFLHGR